MQDDIRRALATGKKKTETKIKETYVMSVRRQYVTSCRVMSASVKTMYDTFMYNALYTVAKCRVLENTVHGG